MNSKNSYLYIIDRNGIFLLGFYDKTVRSVQVLYTLPQEIFWYQTIADCSEFNPGNISCVFYRKYLDKTATSSVNVYQYHSRFYQNKVIGSDGSLKLKGIEKYFEQGDKIIDLKNYDKLIVITLASG